MKKTTEQFTAEVLEKWGISVTGEYLGAHKKVSFLCPNGHANEATATNLLQRGYKCKECTTGYKVVTKMQWTKAKIEEATQLLQSNSTKKVAALLSTTVDAINNMLASHSISNPRERISELKLIEVLLAQDRELVEITGDTAVISCNKGHTHKQDIGNVIHKQINCPSCCFNEGVSKAEKTLREYIESIYNGWVVYNDRTILEGKEVDIVIPDLGIAIEFNGTYWHSEDKVGTKYHMHKTNAVEALNYQLIHIKDYDWVHNKEIVKSILASKLAKTNKIFARNTTLKPIPFPKEFLSNNHIQGAGQPTSTNYGLFYKDELVAVATYAKPRFSDEADLELIRFCSKLNTTIVGGLSKLLKPVSGKSILTYASRDYSNGKAYKKTGFKYIRTTEPSFEYYNKYERVSRYKAQSLDKNELLKYYKYYNSGNLVFIKPA